MYGEDEIISAPTKKAAYAYNNCDTDLVPINLPARATGPDGIICAGSTVYTNECCECTTSNITQV